MRWWPFTQRQSDQRTNPQDYGNGQALIEQLKQWERGLGEERVQQAIVLVRSWGWDLGGMNPPPFVWAEAYRRIDPQMTGLGLKTDTGESGEAMP